ncbi:histidine-phosphotransfer domain HPT domain-containing protein [Mycena belliarum]|uniref:Histidine-phosphotransfer domain HPT domain-containing protein n=1 Tax=Mycena belliarum TaxID=1033014 RepID=A0AAD6XMM7_9AGAR|nr:histidine-phosphotransfer domain HPT domain-containing protein [Mycena belliae]
MAADDPPPHAPPPPVAAADAPNKDPKEPKSAPPPPPPAAPVPVPAPDPDPDSAAAEPVNMDIFGQILDLDEEGSHDFSKEMVAAYFTQASTTFDDMDRALLAKKLPVLSELGHFLKGSSAALGISEVQAACEKMQHYGDLLDADAKTGLAPPEALAKIDALLPAAKAEYARAERWFKRWYADRHDAFEDEAGADADAGAAEAGAP